MSKTNTDSFDIEMAVRVYPGVSKSPVLAGTKLETFGTCFASLVDATRGFSTKIHVIYDNCPQEFADFVRSTVADTHTLQEHFVDGIGNEATFRLQREILKESSAKLIGLVEDDYIFGETSMRELMDFAAKDDYAGFYTIFNSSDYYRLDLHGYRSRIKFNKGRYWRNVSSTTLTFFGSPGLLRRFDRVFSSFDKGNNDHAMWLVITKRYIGSFLWCVFSRPSRKKFWRLYKVLKYLPHMNFFHRANLWVPLPSLGAHLEEEGFPLDRVFDKRIGNHAA